MGSFDQISDEDNIAQQADDEYWMRRALAQAKLAAQQGEVPIGAIITCDGKVIAASHDRKEISKDPTAHAEIQVIRDAANYFGDWRLNSAAKPSVNESNRGGEFLVRETTLYVTLEPCIMCLGAILQSRVSRLVFGARNKRWALSDSQINEMLKENQFNHHVDWKGGVLKEDCKNLLQKTFRSYREK